MTSSHYTGKKPHLQKVPRLTPRNVSLNLNLRPWRREMEYRKLTIPEWIKPAVLGFGLGAVAIMIVGFSWGGWVTGSKADKMASDRADVEVVKAFVPVCVAMSISDPNAAITLAELEKAQSYKRDDVIMDSGWATMPGASSPSRQLALACIEKIMEKT